MPTDDEIRALVRDVNGEYYPPNALENTRRLFSIFRDPALPKSQRWLIRSLVYGRLNVMKNLCHALNELLPGEGAGGAEISPRVVVPGHAHPAGR